MTTNKKYVPPMQIVRPTQPVAHPELLTDNPCQVYPRVSTPEQKKNVSAEMQQDKSFAVLCGWVDDGENIIMDKDDLGLSGQLPMEERPAFVKMLRRIADGTIKTVIAAQVDRLFRDRWGAEYSKFMEICFTYGVKVVTPNPNRTGIDFVYDFSISWHVDKFRRKCEEAWNYMENHIYGRMLPAQDALWLAGFWCGGNIPFGFIVDRREKLENGEKNPNYRKYVVYEPHAEIVVQLLERYRATGGQLRTVLREIMQRPVLFPAFDKSIDREIVNKFKFHKKVIGEEGEIVGYTITTESGLRSILSNVAYAGYWEYKGAVIRSDNHDAIVDYGLFIYAFSRLSPTNLDGSPNEELLEKRQQYMKKHIPERPAYLKNHLASLDPLYFIYTSSYPLLVRGTKGKEKRIETFYGFYLHGHALQRFHAKYMITTHDVDDIFMDRLIERLQQVQGFDNFLEHEKSVLTEQMQLRKDTERDIQAVRASMKRIKDDVEAGRVQNPDLLDAMDKRYTKLGNDLVRLEASYQEMTISTNKAEKRRSYKQLMHEVGKAWQKLIPPDEIPLMIDTFVKKIELEPLAPHFYKMIIDWYDPEWGIDEGICYRDGNSSIHWTEEEDTILREHWPHTSRAELIKLLPRRNTDSMNARAHLLHIKRCRKVPEPDVPTTFCLQDIEVMQQCGLKHQELAMIKGGKLIRWAFQHHP